MMNLTRTASLRTLAAIFIVMLGVSTHARAQGGCTTGGTGCGSVVPPTPEIDPSLGTGAAALLAGSVLLVRSRRRP